MSPICLLLRVQLSHHLKDHQTPNQEISRISVLLILVRLIFLSLFCGLILQSQSLKIAKYLSKVTAGLKGFLHRVRAVSRVHIVLLLAAVVGAVVVGLYATARLTFDYSGYKIHDNLSEA